MRWTRGPVGVARGSLGLKGLALNPADDRPLPVVACALQSPESASTRLRDLRVHHVMGVSWDIISALYCIEMKHYKES